MCLDLIRSHDTCDIVHVHVCLDKKDVISASEYVQYLHVADLSLLLFLFLEGFCFRVDTRDMTCT